MENVSLMFLISKTTIDNIKILYIFEKQFKNYEKSFILFGYFKLPGSM